MLQPWLRLGNRSSELKQGWKTVLLQEGLSTSSFLLQAAALHAKSPELSLALGVERSHSLLRTTMFFACTSLYFGLLMDLL